MQKKIVAAICAAALALAMPAAAFAAQFTAADNPSEVTASIAKVENGNVTLKNIELHGVKDYAISANVTAAGTGAAPSNAIAGSVATFDIQAYGFTDKDTQLKPLATLGTKYNYMTAEVEFNEAVTANLPINNNYSNLWVAGRFVSNNGGVEVPVAAKQVTVDSDDVNGSADWAGAASTAAGNIELKKLGTGKLTVWMQEGSITMGLANTDDMAKEAAADASKSPKTGELL